MPCGLPEALSYLGVGSLAVAKQAVVKRDRTHTQGTDGSGCSSARGHIVTGVRHFVAVRCWVYFELLMSLFVKAVSACAEIVHFTDGKTVGNTSKFCYPDLVALMHTPIPPNSPVLGGPTIGPYLS